MLHTQFPVNQNSQFSTTARQGYCPDSFCGERLLIELSKSDMVECYYCGQIHFSSELVDVKPITMNEEILLKKRLSEMPIRRGPEWIRINGLSSFFCKLISPTFTLYTVDDDNIARLWSQISDSGFDWKSLAECAFEIEQNQLFTEGYGLDRSGSLTYLSETLSAIANFNEDQLVLVPLHVGDSGNCLTYAISRALVGREIYWHALKENLTYHLLTYQEWYRQKIGEFILEEDWREIIDACDPSYVFSEDRLTCRTVLIFALANLLYRPIILLDTPENMAIGEDFSALFLPVMRDVDECKNEDNTLYKPLVIGWADSYHTHFVPLVSVAELPAASLPRTFLPNVWGADKGHVDRYITFDSNCCVLLGGTYFSKYHVDDVIKAMTVEYINLFRVSPVVVSDYCEDVLKLSKYSQEKIDNYCLKKCLKLCETVKLWRCMVCWRLSKINTIPRSHLKFGGSTYNALIKKIGDKPPAAGQVYTLEHLGTFDYNEKQNCFEPRVLKLLFSSHCKSNQNQLRVQFSNGSIGFRNGDHSRTPAPDSFCTRKMKHIWNEVEYDCIPLVGQIYIEFGQKVLADTFEWFSCESDVDRNSDIKAITDKIISNHFPDIEMTGAYDQLRNMVYSAIVRKVNSLVLKGGPFCSDPCWKLDLIEPLKEKEPGPVKVDDGQFELPPLYNKHSSDGY